MSNKVHHIAVLIDCDIEKAIHWFEFIRQIKTYLKAETHFIVWKSDLADIARARVDIDKVHLLSRSLFKLNDYKILNKLIQEYNIEKCIEIGEIPKFISWKIKQNNILTIIKVLEKLEPLDSDNNNFFIYPNYTAKVNYNKRIAYSPLPFINYKDFLDLDTQLVLDIKQNLGLISYDDRIINKSFVCGHVGIITKEFIRYLEYNSCEWYDISIKEGSFILPEEIYNNLPVLYELLDCIVISGNLDNNIQYQILNAMASGTIVIAPRNDTYQELLGRGALYYSPNSSSELAACIDVVKKNENKKTMIRELASDQFQRKYSYQAIAQFWANILAKI